MRNFFKKVDTTLSLLYAWGEVLCVIAAFLMLAWALQPVSLIITAIVAFVATGFAVSRGKLNAAIAITGIILYILCWPINARYGVWVGQAVWTAGMLLWFSSVFWRLQLRPLAVSW